MTSAGDLLNQAEGLLQQGNDTQASSLYQLLVSDPQFQGMAYFRLGEISNRAKDINQSIEYHTKAFEVDPHLYSKILPQNIAHRNYVYQVQDWVESLNCPLCSKEGKLHSCYNAGANMDFHPAFDPVKVWVECEDCIHLFALSQPKNLKQALQGSVMASLKRPEAGALPEESKILNEILEFSQGKRLLEIGAGLGECLAVAQEMLLEVEGLEIRTQYADMVRNWLQVPVYECDFLDFDTSDRYDILIMGDVIEHFLDPIQALQKCTKLLNPGGVLWMSTPNYQSAWSKIHRDQDPMWKVSEHLHYFSYRGITKLLEAQGLKVLRYTVSKKYNGSMELITKLVS